MTEATIHADLPRRPRMPFLLILGMLILAVLHLLHFGSVLGWTAQTPLDFPGRLVRANMTPLAWCGYLMFLLGLLAWRDGRSWLWQHFNRFTVCWLWSVPAW